VYRKRHEGVAFLLPYEMDSALVRGKCTRYYATVPSIVHRPTPGGRRTGPAQQDEVWGNLQVHRGRSAAGSGKTVTDTATAVEVTRQTVSEWLHHHPGFQAALNSRRQELRVGMTDSLRRLLSKALDVLKCETEGEQPLPAAVHVLKACGLYGMLPPRGPTEVEDAVLAEQERQSERRHKAVFAAAF